MAPGSCSYSARLNNFQIKGCLPLILSNNILNFKASGRSTYPIRKKQRLGQTTQCTKHCFLAVTSSVNNYKILPSNATTMVNDTHVSLVPMLADIDPDTAKVAIGFIGPFLSAFSFLFILRIIMSWYPKLPVGKLPYVIAYAPTEPLLIPTRKLIPPLAGVDVTPVVWFGLVSFLNEILVGPQGLLVLLSQQVR